MRKIGPNDTIADILATLDKPEEYLRGVVGHLSEGRKENGGAWVKIGITGGGAVPNYMIGVPPDDAGNPPLPWKVFNGRSHKELFDRDQMEDRNWSRGSMTTEEAQKLRGEIRMMKRNPPSPRA